MVNVRADDVVVGRTYGNWSQPPSPGLWRLGFVGTAWLFFGTFVIIFVAIWSYLGALLLAGWLVMSLVPLLLVDKHGRNAYTRLWERVQWIEHRRSGRQLYLGGPLSVSPTKKSALPGLAAQLSVSESLDSHNRPFVVLHQPSVGHVSTVLELSPPGDGLVDLEQINRQVAAYGQWLAQLGHEDGFVGASVVVETAPDTGVRLVESIESRVVDHAPDLAKAALREIAETFPAGSAETSYRLSLTWSRSRSGTKRRSLLDVVDEIAIRLPDLTNGLANTGAGSVRPMTEQQLARTVRASFEPSVAKSLDSTNNSLDWDGVGPIQAEEKKGHYLHDGVASISWFMGIAPRGSIRSTVLRRLLEPHREVARKRVTILYRPYDAARAASLVEEDVTNAHFLANQSHRPKARMAHTLRSVEQSAAEEALGAGLVRFAMIVTATGDETVLDRTASVIEHSASASRINLRRAWRTQATSFLAGLPLGIVLPAHVRMPGEWREHV